MAISPMPESLFQIPAFIKVGVSFAGILLVNRFGLSLGISILLFAVALSLWSGTGLRGLYGQASAFSQPQNYLLPAVILLLLFFTEALNRSGRMKRTIDALKEWLKSKKMLLAGLPALVGLLPMPGGAVVSAPLVASVDEEGDLNLAHKVAINYWFRHIWEYWWPLYPGVILAMSYSGLPVAVFFLIQMPFSLAMILGGYFFILKIIPLEKDGGERSGILNRDDVRAALDPIGLLVITSLVGSALFPLSGMDDNLASLVSMVIGLVLALSFVFAKEAAAFLPSLRLFRDRNTWMMMLLVIGIQVFSGVLKYPLNDAGMTIVTLMRDEFLRAGIPIVTLIMLIPFISGAVTGVAFGFVGASFPIVFALVGPDPSYGTASATTALAYGFGYMGMMLSPMHVCFVVTGEYFKTSLYGAYRYILGPMLVMLFTALVLSGLYYVLL
jgi:uncharacterized protein